MFWVLLLGCEYVMTCCLVSPFSPILSFIDDGFWVSTTCLFCSSSINIRLHPSYPSDQPSNALVHTLSHFLYLFIPFGFWFVCVFTSLIQSFLFLPCFYQNLPCGSLDVLCLL